MLSWKNSSRTMRNVKIGLFAIICIGVGVLLASNLNWSPTSHANAPQPQASGPDPQGYAIPGGESPFVAVAEKVKPSVVNIRAEIIVKGKSKGMPLDEYFEDPFGDFFREFFKGSPEGEGKEYEQRSEGRGSGVIIDRDGYILTNNHVVEGAENVKVKLSDDREFDAEIVGTDPMTDVALLRIQEKGVVPGEAVAQLGDSDQIRVGDWAIAVGNPFGLDRTVTVGVISAKGRSNLHIFDNGGRDRSPYFQDFIQTDASINFGNSGGPLVNIKGEVVGINSAINAQAQGIGFAIPINIVKEITKQLRQSGKVVRGFLGIYFTELTPDIVEAKDLDVSKGVIVDQVMKGSPAATAGIEQGDVVVGFNGKGVESGSQFQFMVAGTNPGSVVELEIIRAGKRKTVDVRVGERESSEVAQSPSQEKEPWLGLTVESLDGSFARQNNINEDEGVVVVEVEPGSPADDKDIQSGDVVLEIDNQKIVDLKEYSRVAGGLKDRQKAILFLVKRGERAFYSALKPEKK